MAKKMAEESKIGIRNNRRDANDAFKRLKTKVKFQRMRCISNRIMYKR